MHIVLFALELRRVSKLVPVELLLDLVPKTAPRMIPTIIRAVNKQIGMTNFFLRYQGRLVNVMQNLIKNTVRKI